MEERVDEIDQIERLKMRVFKEPSYFDEETLARGEGAWRVGLFKLDPELLAPTLESEVGRSEEGEDSELETTEFLGEGSGETPEVDEAELVEERRSTVVDVRVLDLKAFWRLKVPVSPATVPARRIGAGAVIDEFAALGSEGLSVESPFSVAAVPEFFGSAGNCMEGGVVPGLP